MELTPEDRRLTAFIMPEGRIFRWKVMPFRLGNAPAVFQEIMNQVMVQVRSHSKARRVFTRGGALECHIHDVMLGTRTVEDHRILSRVSILPVRCFFWSLSRRRFKSFFGTQLWK